MRDLVAEHKNISISIGVHPNETEGHDPSVNELVDVALRDSAIAIGETGLDYFRLGDVADLDCQQQRFRNHITAAKLTNKPIIIHTRDAKNDTIKIIARRVCR